MTWFWGMINGIPLFTDILIWKPGQACWVIFVLPDYYLHIFLAQLLFCAMILIIVYTIIFCTIYQHKFQNEVQQTSNVESTTCSVGDLHMLKAFVILVGIFAITCLPFCFVAEASMQLEEDFVQGPKFITIYKVVSFLIYLNSAANPVIYSLRIPSFRLGLKNICCHWQKNSVDQQSNQRKSSTVLKKPSSDPGGVYMISFNILPN